MPRVNKWIDSLGNRTKQVNLLLLPALYTHCIYLPRCTPPGLIDDIYIYVYIYINIYIYMYNIWYIIIYNIGYMIVYNIRYMITLEFGVMTVPG